MNPITLSKTDLHKYPHLKERVQEEDPTVEKVPTPRYYRSMMEYREKYRTLLAGVIGTCIGVVITVIAMVI